MLCDGRVCMWCVSGYVAWVFDVCVVKKNQEKANNSPNKLCGGYVLCVCGVSVVFVSGVCV